jgi:hypothetical protein
MYLDYTFAKNHLTKKDPNDRYARVVNPQSTTEEEYADRLAARNLGISKPQALSTIEALWELVLEDIEQGINPKLRLFDIHLTIPGVYQEGDHPKEAAVKITPKKLLTDTAKKTKLRHVEAPTLIYIDFVDDVKSGTRNDKVTQGGTVKITGHNLKLEPTGDSRVYAEFFSLEDPEAIYPIPSVDVIINSPSELMVIAPKMVKDEPVQFRVYTLYSGGAKPLHQIRTATSETLIVI